MHIDIDSFRIREKMAQFNLGSGFVPIKDLHRPYDEAYAAEACFFRVDRPNPSFVPASSAEYVFVDKRQRVSGCRSFMSDGGNYPGILPGDCLQ